MHEVVREELHLMLHSVGDLEHSLMKIYTNGCLQVVLRQWPLPLHIIQKKKRQLV